MVTAIGVARGCSWCTCTPQGGEYIFWPNLQEKCVSAPPGHEVHPQPEQESIFRIVLAGFGGIFRQSFKGDDQKIKKVVNFFGKKVQPPDKILATPMVTALSIVDLWSELQ